MLREVYLKISLFFPFFHFPKLCHKWVSVPPVTCLARLGSCARRGGDQTSLSAAPNVLVPSSALGGLAPLPTQPTI